MKNAKLIVIATTPGSRTITRPGDDNSLDIAGFDLNAPTIIRNHIMGTVDPTEADEVNED